MPNDPLSPVKPGDPLPNKAETFNQVFEAVRAWRKKSRELPRGPVQKDYPPCVVVRVYNDTGATLDISDIVELGASLDSLTTDPLVVGTFPIVAGETPTAADIPFGILLDRIESNQIGRAVIYGSAVCSVEVNDPAHVFAVPIAANSAKLETATEGPVRIVSRESGSSGVKVAHVVIQQQGKNSTTSPPPPVSAITTGNTTTAGSSGTGDSTTDNLKAVTTTGVQIDQTATANRSTIQLIAASTTQMGAVTTSSQTFTGNKIFDKNLAAGTASTGTGDVVELYDQTGNESLSVGYSGSYRYINLFTTTAGRLYVGGTCETSDKYKNNGIDGVTGTQTGGYRLTYSGGIVTGETSYTPANGELTDNLSLTTDDTWTDGTETTALAAGTYRFVATVHGRIELDAATAAGSQGMILARMKNNTSGVTYDPFRVCVAYEHRGDAGENILGVGTGSRVIAVAASDKMVMQYKRVTNVNGTACTFDTAGITADANGWTYLTWDRLN